MADSPLLEISIGGGPLAIIDGKIYALLMPDADQPARWTAASGELIRFTDQGSGQMLSVPSTTGGTQAVTYTPGEYLPGVVTRWQVAQIDADGNPTPVTDVTESGFYTLQAPDSDLFLSRNPVEDYSIRPKPAVLQDPDNRWGPVIIQVA
jgi:hypothetical protein